MWLTLIPYNPYTKNKQNGTRFKMLAWATVSINQHQLTGCYYLNQQQNNMKEKLKFLFRDKKVIPVFVMCIVLHVAVFFHFNEFFSLPIGWIIVFATLFDIGATICIIEAVIDWRKEGPNA